MGPARRGIDWADVGGLLAALLHAGVILVGVGLLLYGVGYLVVRWVADWF